MSESTFSVDVVDDEDSVRKALHRLLRSAGLNVSTYPTGAEFLASLELRRPDCVVLDLHMPGVTGFEVQARLNSMASRPPVIIMTGHDSPEAHNRAMAAGAIVYLRKPTRDETLLDAVYLAIGRRRPS